MLFNIISLIKWLPKTYGTKGILISLFNSGKVGAVFVWFYLKYSGKFWKKKKISGSKSNFSFFFKLRETQESFDFIWKFQGSFDTQEKFQGNFFLGLKWDFVQKNYFYLFISAYLDF